MSFAGLLKVEELLIALRDDRQLLNDPKVCSTGTTEQTRRLKPMRVELPGLCIRTDSVPNASLR